jgi:hypothetical protein
MFKWKNSHLNIASASITVNNFGFVIVAPLTFGHIGALTQMIPDLVYIRSIEVRVKIDILNVISAGIVI